MKVGLNIHLILGGVVNKFCSVRPETLRTSAARLQGMTQSFELMK